MLHTAHGCSQLAGTLWPRNGKNFFLHSGTKGNAVLCGCRVAQRVVCDRKHVVIKGWPMAANTPDAHSGGLDINAVFRSGGRAVEFLDHINQACLVMLYETGIVPREHAQRIAVGINTVRAEARAETRTTGVPRRS